MNDGGRDGLVGGDRKVLSVGHGHGQEREQNSSVASPIGSSPIACIESTMILNDVVLTTTTTNIALDSIPHNIDDALVPLIFPSPVSTSHDVPKPTLKVTTTTATNH